MTISPQQLLRLSASNEHQRSEKPTVNKASARKFQQCLRTAETDHRPRDRGLFSLLEEEESEEECTGLSSAPSPTSLIASAISDSKSAVAIASSVLSADLELLFEKMAAAMIVQTSTHETETTLFLDNPQSLFCGTQITIREFSSAPKVFNIEITSNPTAAACIEAHKASLLAAFHQERFSFSVHRLETYMQQEEKKPVLFRKETPDNNSQHQGEHPQ